MLPRFLLRYLLGGITRTIRRFGADRIANGDGGLWTIFNSLDIGGVTSRLSEGANLPRKLFGSHPASNITSGTVGALETARFSNSVSIDVVDLLSAESSYSSVSGSFLMHFSSLTLVSLDSVLTTAASLGGRTLETACGTALLLPFDLDLVSLATSTSGLMALDIISTLVF